MDTGLVQWFPVSVGGDSHTLLLVYDSFADSVQKIFEIVCASFQPSG